MMARKATHSLLLAILAFTTVAGSFLATPNAAQAQIPVTVTGDVVAVAKEVKETVTNSFVEAAVTAVVGGVNYFATQLAYSAAVALTTSCPGQIVCWSSFGENLDFKHAWQGAVGEAIGTLSEQGGFTKLGFNLCKPPNPLIALNIQLGLLDDLKPPPPKCDFNQIGSNWETFKNSLSSQSLLKQLKPTFSPGQAPLSATLRVLDGVATEKAEAERQSTMKSLMDASAGGGFNDVRDPVSGRVKAPASVTHEEFANMKRAQKEDPQNFSASAAAGQIASRAVVSVVANTLQTFGMTLISRLWNKLANGLLSTEELVAAQPDIVLNPEAILSPSASSIQESAATRTQTVTTRDAGLVDPLLDFSTCPTSTRGPKNCVIDQQFASAIRVADVTPLTVLDAMKQGLLHADWPLISSGDAAKNQDSYCYTYGYCESNLKKLRAARIIPIGWEIAASNSPSASPWLLKTVVDNFENCNDKGAKDESHPYCHLIDPNWILRVPLTQCRAVGFGEQLVTGSIATRSEICLDQQTCLKMDDNGKCVGGWGYCTQERNIWRFSGDSCPAQFNTCRVLTARTGGTRSYNINTIDHGVCNADTVGCRRYSTTLNSVSCTLTAGDTDVDANGTCTNKDGCVCTTSPLVCRVSRDGDSCTNASTGEVCRLDGVCSSSSCACRNDHTCRVRNGEKTCSSVVGSDATTGDDWTMDPARFLNAKAQSCDAGAAGCTQLVRLNNVQALNLVRNGGFDETEDGDGDGNFDHAKYWTPFGAVPAGSNGSLLRDGSKSGSGNTAMLISTAAAAGGKCTLSGGNACTNVSGCACNGPSGYNCKAVYGSSTCSYTSRIVQDGIEMRAATTYTLSMLAVPFSGSAAGVTAKLTFSDTNGSTVSGVTGDDVSSFAGQAPNTAITSSCIVSGDSLVFSFRGTADTNSRGILGSCTFIINSPISFGTLELSSNTVKSYVDNVMLSEGGGSPFHEGYGDNGGRVNAKIAPAYLGCTGEPDDLPECASYAGVCRESELGCDGYTPTNGDPMVPAIVGPTDMCPQECAGYDVFKQEGTTFDQPKPAVAFIPSTATSCTEADVGCSEFTNVESEAVEYYTSLRLCMKDDATKGTFYSWEGSDTTGYQLKTWNLKKTTDTNGAVSNVVASTSDVCAAGACANASAAPCTVLDGSAKNCASKSVALPGNSTAGYCTRDDIDAGNFDCREFYDELGNRHYRLLSKTIIVSDQCHAYRITTSTQQDCANSNGFWDDNKAQCIYNADSSQSIACGKEQNNCRAYKGNAATNVRTIKSETFESGIAGWTDATDVSTANLEQSPESVILGGHSLKMTYVSGSAVARTAAVEVAGLVAPKRSYSLTFWARGTGAIAVSFRSGKGSLGTCTNDTACTDAAGCTCQTSQGFSCKVASGSSTCSLSPETPAGKLSFKPTSAKLYSEWRQFTLSLPDVQTPSGYAMPWGSRSVKLEFAVTSTCPTGTCPSTSDVFIDNIQLKEVQDNIFVIRDSWKTPASCDSSSTGAYSPQEMLGCREYRNTANASSYLRSFSRLCRDKAIGCAAYSDTKNTPDNPYSQSYNAVCKLTDDAGNVQSCGTLHCLNGGDGSVCNASKGCSCDVSYKGKTQTCKVNKGETACDISVTPDGGSSCICNYNVNNPAAQADAPQLASDVCRVSVGDTQCRFNLDRIDVSTTASSTPDRVNVHADTRTYLVVRSENICSAEQIGCTAMGQSHETYEAKCELKDAKNLPMKCGELACSRSGNSCKDSRDCSSSEVCAPTSCSCALGNATCEVAFGDSSCTVSLERATIDKWNATVIKDLPSSYGDILCKEEANGCDQYSSSEGLQYFKDPGDHVCTYREGVSYNGQTRSGWFRKSDAGKFFPCYPELLKQGTVYEIYKNADPVCRRSTACTNEDGCECTPPGGTTPVCKILPGHTICGYQGWVAQCDSQYDRCEEFIDPSATTATNPLGQPYYYLMNSKLDRQTCAGGASLKQGCVLFKQTSNTANLYSSATTYYASERDNANGKVAPVNCNLNTHDPACNMRCVSVPAGTCAADTTLQCHSDADCRRCSNNASIVCRVNSDCGSGTCGGVDTCVGDKKYTTACQRDSDCNRGQGELCAGTNHCSIETSVACNSATDCKGYPGQKCVTLPVESAAKLQNDTNIIIKVRPDRECAEWLSCRTYATQWDEQSGKYKSVCSGFGPCTENKQVGQAFECVSPVDAPKKRFTQEDYSKRSVGWAGQEYSGFSAIDVYSPAYLLPVNIVGGYCTIPTPISAQNKACSTAADCTAAKTGAKLDGTCTNSVCVVPTFVIPGKNGAPTVPCSSSDSCTKAKTGYTADGTCKQLSGVCMAAGDRTWSSCNTAADCCASADGTTCTNNAYCSFNFLNTHRYATVLDPLKICSKNSDCTAAKTGYEEDGACIDHRCALNPTGGAFDTTDVNAAPRCRAYPESDAPYSESVLDTRGGSSHPGYDQYGQPFSKKSQYTGANVCTRGNDCSCNYTRWTYGKGGGISHFLAFPGTTTTGPVVYNGDKQINVPLGDLASDGICVGGPYEGAECNSAIKVTSSTDPAKDPCNSAAGGTCQKLSSVNYMRGWQGYCLDLDKSLNVGGDPDKFDCNLWLPVDQLEGAPDNYNQFEEAGFNPPQAQVSYCVTAEGNALGDSSAPYDYVIYDDSNKGPSMDSSAFYFYKPIGFLDVVSFLATSGISAAIDKSGDEEQWITYDVSSKNIYKNQMAGIRLEGDALCYNDQKNGGPRKLTLYLTEGNGWTNAMQWDEGKYLPDAGVHGDTTTGGCIDLLNNTGMDQDDIDKNCMAVKAAFDSNGKFTGFTTLIAHDSDTSCGPYWKVKIAPLMRENCVDIARVHDNSKTPRNIAWTDTLYQSSKLAKGNGDGFVYNEASDRPQTDPVSTIDVSPLGRIDPQGLVVGKKIDAQKPLSVAQSEGGSPYAYFQKLTVSDPNANPYNLAGPNKTLAGDEFLDVAGFPFSCIGPCALKQSSSIGASAGIDKMSRYFAVTYDNFHFDPKNHTLKQINSSEGVYAYAVGTDKREQHLAEGKPPMVLAVNTSACASGADGLCNEGAEGITVNNNPGTGNYVPSETGQAKISLFFYAFADPNRMPIRRKIIDFGDGPPVPLEGAFKNHRGCSKTSGVCGTAANPPVCGSQDVWGFTGESCEPRYFQETHTYRCNSELVGTGKNAYPDCNGLTFPCKAKDGQAGKWACHFKPRVQILDNWGVCNGACSGDPGGQLCFNKAGSTDNIATFLGNMIHTSAADLNCDAAVSGDCTDVSPAPFNECTGLTSSDYSGLLTTSKKRQQPWTAFKGEIILTP